MLTWFHLGLIQTLFCYWKQASLYVKRHRFKMQFLSRTEDIWQLYERLFSYFFQKGKCTLAAFTAKWYNSTTDCLNSLAVTQPEMWSTLWLADSNITETTHHAGANCWRLLWFHTWRIKHACVNFEIASLLTKELIIAGLSAQKRNAVELHSKMGLTFLVVVTCEQLGELY